MKFVSHASGICCIILVYCCNSHAQRINQVTLAPVTITGAMKDVMWKGELYGKISLDTIADKEHLYGFGPAENMTGEILIADGRCFEANVVSPVSMKVTETFHLKAPFFARCNIRKWTEQSLPDSVTDLQQLENYLIGISGGIDVPYLFKLGGTITTAAIHVLNMPAGTAVKSPEDTRKGTVVYKIKNEPVAVIGFFSTQHKTIFTHHDTFLHLHLLTNDHKKMGPLDAITFKPGAMKLYLPG
jgi:acetolactate decarboxylase